MQGLCAGLVALLATMPSLAAPVQWSIAGGGNDHYYEYVATNLSWAEARTNALSRTFAGQTGYLATITSMGEQNFLFPRFLEYAWVGGSDAETEGIWKWMDGPEAGLIFWNNGPTSLFSDWNSPTDEPNDSAGGEDYLQFAIFGPDGSGTWNDDGPPGHALARSGYIVEYGASAVPLPGAIWLFTAAVGVLGSVRRKYAIE